MTVRAIRGAVQVEGDDGSRILAATRELIRQVMARNGVPREAVISMIFTTTDDLRAAFPARAARDLGYLDVPLMCAREIDVDAAPPRMVRLLVHVESDLPRARIRHVYLGGAAQLRPDLADGIRSGPATADESAPA